MQPKSQRRVHGAEFKAQVLAECQKPGASVAAVALAHGLNVNLVRKWLVGRGIKRAGLAAPRTVTPVPPNAAVPSGASLQFVPVELAPAASASDEAAASGSSDIHIDLARGDTRLSVRWPATQASACAAWLYEVAAALKE
jgi:transposase